MHKDDYYIEGDSLVCSQRVHSILEDALTRYMVGNLPVDVTVEDVQYIIDEIDKRQATD